ncbi:CoA-acylating methylmalonate-semialdehyde dehydrogenase [Bacillus sp. P14.5]|uniref:CoA-acylating methylmalonate-semialdehyde dehydrogenase n=1 Tax=Bacillus sp. P14.5 TaxID=1983400 RepID=UPI001F057B02|nr:CoA-acylating methylmalonate-semialdehyde dehydrogenase [Bacillus sp. P14.5]
MSNFIGNKKVPTRSQNYGAVYNPSNGREIAQVPISSKEDVDAAVQTAREAFETWSEVPVPKRARLMFSYHRLLVEHEDELAKLITLENGKSFKEAKGEVLRGIECVEFAAGAPNLMKGESLTNIASNMDSSMYRYPVGVVGGITPFNFPMMVPCWMFPLAIVCGNTFVLKPSEKTPLLANRLAELLKEAGLPDGVFNIVHGAKDVVEGLLEHEQVDAISFVGSQPVAKLVYERASQTGKRVQALSGAKNHHIVMPDASVRQSVDEIIKSSYGSAGERCMACSAVVVVGDQPTFMEALIHEVENLTVGDGFQDNVSLTPLIRKEHRDKVADYIEKGVAEGAELLCDGRNHPSAQGEGFYLGGTLLDQVEPEMTVAKEEIFGPVVSVLRAETIEEAVDKVNQSRFGNSAVLYSNDSRAVRYFREKTEAGMLGVNVGVPAPMAFFPFSGWKESFYGDLHANGSDGVNFYTRRKMLTSRF